MRIFRKILALLILLLLPSHVMAKTVVRSKVVNYHLSVPNPVQTIGSTGSYGFGVVWCGATALIINGSQQQLKLTEAYEILGSCFLPVFGGLIVKQITQRHPEWNNYKLEPKPLDHGKIDW